MTIHCGHCGTTWTGLNYRCPQCKQPRNTSQGALADTLGRGLPDLTLQQATELAAYILDRYNIAPRTPPECQR